MSKKDKKHTVGELTGTLGRKAPFDLAEEWDNVGFLAGRAEDEITGIIAAVNLGPEALAAAEESGANVIVCHHPPIFKPISKLTSASSPYLYEAVRRGISVIAMHTNFDLSSEEMNRGLAEKLGFKFCGFLAPRGGTNTPKSIKQGKFMTYVPADKIAQVREAIWKTGAGKVGHYKHCSFSFEGEGTFFGNEATNPKTGQSGRLETVAERRLEVIFPWKLCADVIEAARSAHPYEEMAYDVVELSNPTRIPGYGFVADFRGETGSHLTFPKLLDGVKQAFKLQTMTVSGPGLSDGNLPSGELKVRRLAFSPGSGSAFVNSAAAKGVDVYVCGEVGYHQMIEARQKGLTLVVLGHSYSERFFVETVSEWCAALGPVTKVFEVIHGTF